MKKSARWGWGIALLAAAGLGLVLAFVLSLLAQGPARYERHFVWLFWLNVVVATLLVVVISVAGVRLVLRFRQRKFGSRLLLKLAAIFALVGVLPGALIYMVSYQFVSRSIEAWFDTRVASALDAGLALGKGTLEALAADLTEKTRGAAERFSESQGVPELVALAKAKPLAFASGGNGSPGHMIGEQFKRELGLDLMTHIPYKGNAPASQSILAGETQLFFGALPGTLQNVRAGKLRPIATMGNERSNFIPDVPTAKELGFPKLLTATNWFGLMGPAGMPRDIIDRLHREIGVIAKDKDFIERIEKAGYRPWVAGPEETRAKMRSDSAAWAAIIKSANIRPE